MDPHVANSSSGKGVTGHQVDAHVAATLSKTRGVTGQTEQKLKDNADERHQNMDITEELETRRGERN